MKKVEYDQGYYIPTNKSKYVGKGNPFYRSSFEKKMFHWCDHRKAVLEWSSESIAIPYLFEVDKRVHRYYPDVIAKIKTNQGIKKYIIEIKPYRQTKPPDKPKNKNKKRQERYVYETIRWIKNKNKWDATAQYCIKYGYEFEIITEKQLWKGVIN